jgi:hypothetical protein
MELPQRTTHILTDQGLKTDSTKMRVNQYEFYCRILLVSIYWRKGIRNSKCILKMIDDSLINSLLQMDERRGV